MGLLLLLIVVAFVLMDSQNSQAAVSSEGVSAPIDTSQYTAPPASGLSSIMANAVEAGANGAENTGGFDVNSNQAVLNAAQNISSSQPQYWSNACACAVTDVVKEAGLQPPAGNHNLVPAWAHWGSIISDVNELQPGDLVILNEHPWLPPVQSSEALANPTGAPGGWDHIGVFSGWSNGVPMYFNVATSAGHNFVNTPLPLNMFQQGNRPPGN